MEQTEYIPGVCNIGPQERKARRTVGWIGLILSAGVWIALLVLRPGTVWYFLVLATASLSASGFIQDRMHFCANFGMRHVFNFSPTVGDAESVTQREFWAADRRKAIRIMLYTFLCGAVATGVAVLVSRFF